MIFLFNMLAGARLIYMIAVAGWLGSCSENTPKPRGYFRIEPPEPVYSMSLPDSLPYEFYISNLAEARITGEGWLNLTYSSLDAVIYCSHLSINRKSLSTVVQQTQELMLRQIKDRPRISQYVFNDAEARVYGVLYISDNDCPSPVQFTLTDSTAHFFRGALYYNCHFDADSLRPVTRYLTRDIREIIQTFNWKH
jgi:gliding motility-associated lipoprotein GldD